jgi:hypothetical protein
MSYKCQTCGKNTRTHDTRGSIRTRICSSNHRHKSIEVPLEDFEEQSEELCYLRALKQAIQPNLKISNIDFSPEPIARKKVKNSFGIPGLTYKPPPHDRFHVRTHFRKKRITLYYGPDLFLAACAIFSWKNKHDYTN